GARVQTSFVDLGMSPLCESFVPPERVDEMEPFYPLHARVCDGCRLVQLAAFVSPDEIFREYAYFSSYSASWVEHARRYVNDVIAGVAVLLAEEGTATFEFPHLMRLMEGLQYDTIYHEHFSYFSLATATRAVNRHGLDVYDVEQIPTHGGSLRLYVGHRGVHAGTERLASLIRRELESKLDD